MSGKIAGHVDWRAECVAVIQSRPCSEVRSGTELDSQRRLEEATQKIAVRRGDGGLAAVEDPHCPELIDLVVNHGADPSAKSEGGNTPLHAAVFYGFPTIIEALIRHGADVNATGYKGYTPLMRLAEVGAKTEVKVVDGWNTLVPGDDNAGHIATVKLLLAAGARVDVRNDDGQTATSLALKNGREGILAILSGDDRQPTAQTDPEKEIAIESTPLPPNDLPSFESSEKSGAGQRRPWWRFW